MNMGMLIFPHPSDVNNPFIIVIAMIMIMIMVMITILINRYTT